MRDDEDIILIKKAVSLEKTRYKDYNRISKKVKNIESKEILKKLSGVEKKHFELLKKQLKSIKKFNDVDKEVLNKNEIKLIKKEKRFKGIKSFSGDINIIREAVKLEIKDPIFYKSLLKKTKNNKLKKVFKFLEDEEEKHLRVLKKKLRDLEILSSKLSSAKDPRIMFYNISNK